MALIKCPKCGKEISDKAKKCPGCGLVIEHNSLEKKEDNTEKNISTIENERKKMIEEAELEIKRMKDTANEEIKMMDESAKKMAETRQKEIDSEFRKREQELTKKKELLEKSQNELEQIRKNQTIKFQHEGSDEKKVNFLNVNTIFMIISTVIMLCFMVVVWEKIEEFSATIDNLSLANQTESEIEVDNTENIPNDVPEEILNENQQEDYIEEYVQDTKEDNISEQEVQNGTNADSNAESIIYGNNDPRIEVSYDTCKTGNYPQLVFSIKNVSSESIKIGVDAYQYINDVSVKNFGTIQYNEEIPAGKATVVNYTFDRNDLSFSTINKIEFCCKSYDSEENEIENSFVFDNLGININ